MSTCNGTEYGYRVEVRDSSFSTTRPHALADGIVGPEWRTVSFPRGDNPAGVPIDLFGGYKYRHDLLEYDAALALAHTIIAQQGLINSIECRLVQYKLEYKFEVTQKGVVDMPAIKCHYGRVKLVEVSEGEQQNESK